MPKTLLNGVNDVLTRVNITSATGQLTSLADSGRQRYIDLAVQLWNEAIDQLYTLQGEAVPAEQKQTTITLVAGTREYTLPADLVHVRWPLLDETNGHTICEYPGGYEQMRAEQVQPGTWEGLPLRAAINPTSSHLRMDRTPTSTEAGRAYTMIYDADNVMTLASSTIPVPDMAYRALVAVVAEAWSAHNRNDFKPDVWRQSLARAANVMTKRLRRTHW